jgi:acyl-CoA synthetase (AMP-forming)/AMP-acid ligase II
LTHRSWARVADRTEEVLGYAEDEVILHVAPLTHGAGFLLLPTLHRGGHNLLCRSYDAARTVTLIDERGVTGMFLVPSMIRMLLDALPEGWTPPDTLRRVYYAGSPIDSVTLREGTERFAGRMIQSFAQMESPMFFTVLDADDHRRSPTRGPRWCARPAGYCRESSSGSPTTRVWPSHPVRTARSSPAHRRRCRATGTGRRPRPRR